MDENTWRNHIMQRSDFTTRLTHLTRRTAEKRAIEVLFTILDSKTILGSNHNGYIIGEAPAVCLQDIPLYSIAENIRYENELFQCRGDTPKMAPRYEGFGVRFNKGSLFKDHSARPVLYGPKEEMIGLLPETEYWRIVTLEYRNHNCIIDWSHEREWRVKGNIAFEYSDIEVIVGCDKAYQEFVKYYRSHNPELLQEIRGIIVLDSLIK